MDLMNKSNHQPPVVDVVFAYSCVIRGFVKESKIEDANDAFLDMKLRGVVPDRYCYGGLIGGFCKKGDIVEALVLCKEMDSRGIKTDDVIVRWVMQYLCGFGMYNETLHMFKHFTQQQSAGVILDEFSFNIAIGVARKLGKTDDAMGLVQEMEARKINPVSEPPTGFEDEWVQLEPNVGEDEEVEGVDQAGVGCTGQFRTTLKNLALHKLTSLIAPHSTILFKGGSKEEPW